MSNEKKEKKPTKKESEPSQNMQRFDRELAKSIREGYSSNPKEPLVETVRYMYLAMKEMERLMKLPQKLSAKEMYERLKGV